jgi:pimeloyl-ACP methyl ester carboxylesterase
VWEPLLDRLAAERELIAVDLPGFGESPLGSGPDVPSLARDLAGFLEEQGLRGVDVCGHSMGGWIALELAKAGVARRVVAVAPAGFWNGWEARFARGQLSLRAWIVRNLRPMLLRGVARPRTRAALIYGQFNRPELITAAQTRDMAETYAAAPGFDATNVAMTGDRFRGGDEVRVPVTLVWGTRDGLLLPRQAERAEAEIPGAELVWIEGGGHFAHWDGAETVAKLLLS